LFLALVAALVSDWGSPGDFTKQLLASGLIMAVIVFGFRRVVRFNLLGCFLAAASLAMLGGAVELTSQPDGFYRSQGYLVVAALVILLGWPLVAWRMGDKQSASV
jgi:hypothetical protein